MMLSQVVNLFGDSKHPGMAYHNRPEEDPYITVHEDSDSDRKVQTASYWPPGTRMTSVTWR